MCTWYPRTVVSCFKVQYSIKACPVLVEETDVRHRSHKTRAARLILSTSWMSRILRDDDSHHYHHDSHRRRLGHDHHHHQPLFANYKVNGLPAVAAPLGLLYVIWVTLKAFLCHIYSYISASYPAPVLTASADSSSSFCSRYV